MKFTADRKTLLKASRAALKVVSESAAIEVLKGLLLTADLDRGLISLTGTDIRNTIQTRLTDGHIEDSGSVIIPAALVTDIFAHLSGDMVSCEVTRGTLHITCGASAFEIPTMPADKYPKINMPVPSSVISVAGLRPIAQRGVIATSTQKSKTSYQAVKLSFTADTSTAYSFDGFRMVNAVSPTCANGTLDVVIHRQSLLLLNSMISEDEVLYVGVKDRYAVFFNENLIFSTLMVDGIFREIDDIVSQLPVIAHALVDSSELYQAVDMAVGCLQEGDDKCVNLCVLDHEVTVSSKAISSAASLNIQAADTEATPAEGFYYSPKLLLDYLRLASGPLSMSFRGDTGFLVMTANHCKYAIQARLGPIIKASKAEKEKKKETKPKVTKGKTTKKQQPKKAA